MEYSIKIIEGLSKPNIGKRMLLLELFSYILIIGMISVEFAIFFWYLPSIIEQTEDKLEYLFFIPIGLAFILSLSIIGLVIYLLSCSLSAQKEVFNLVKEQNHVSLIDCLDLHDFQGQHKMKQKDLFKMKYAIASVGDLQLINALPNLTSILLCRKSLSWSIRKWSAYAIAKIGTVKAVITLKEASEIFKLPTSSMFPRPISPSLDSLVLASIRSIITLIVVRRCLRRLSLHNDFADKKQMIEFVERL